FAEPPNEGKLHAHFVGHGLSLRFVFFEQLVAESRTGRIKYDSHVVWLVVLDQPPQDISEEIRNVRRQATRPREPLRHRRKEGAVDMRHGIHKEEFFRRGRHAGEYSKASWGVREPCSCFFRFHLKRDRRNKKAAQESVPARPSESIAGLYCLFGLFGSGLFAAGCFDAPCSPACAWGTSSIRVPLSRCTFFPAEVITEPCVALDAAAFRFNPFRPNTPWLLEVSCPGGFKPPTAPFSAPATLPPAFAALFTAPPAAPPTLAAVFVTVPTAPPAAEPTPPSAPRPPAIPPPARAPTSPRHPRPPCRSAHATHRVHVRSGGRNSALRRSDRLDRNVQRN